MFTAFALAASLSTSLAAVADEDVRDAGEAVEDELPRFSAVVTATRTERSADEAPVATEVIDRAELRRSGAWDLADLLDTHPGVELTRTFRGTSVGLQGLDPDQVLVLVDGERVAGRLGGAIDVSRFRIEEVERVEIVKGSASAVYGSDAMGGVVNLVPRGCGTGPVVEANTRAGTLGQASLGASGNVGDDDLCLRITGDLLRTAPIGVIGLPDATLIDGQIAGRLNLRGRIALGAAGHLTLHASGQRQDLQGVDRRDTGAVIDRDSRVETLDFTIRPELKSELLGTVTLTAHYSLFRHQLLMDQRGGSALDDYQEAIDSLWELGARIQRTVGERHEVLGGVELFHESLTTPRLTGGAGSRLRGAAYLQNEWKVTDALPLRIVPSVRFDADSQFGSRLSPRLALRWDPHSTVVLRASGGTGFRAASFQELLLDFENTGVGYRIEGNPDLRPERSLNGRLGIGWQPVRQISLSVDAFQNDVDDLITVATVGGSPLEGVRYGYVNVAKALTRGIETSAQLRPVRSLLIDLGYTFTDARDVDAARPLDGRAAHRGSARLAWRFRPWQLESSVRATVVGPRPFHQVGTDGNDVRVDAAPYGIVDARVQKQFGDFFAVVAGVDNLLDAGDESWLAIPPRSFYLGLSGRYLTPTP